MGISNSWFAVQGWTREEALAELGLEPGRELKRDEWVERHLVLGETPGGWLLFLHPELDGAFGKEFVTLSSRGEAVACSVEEHVMYMEARGYRDGAEVWRVVH